MSSWKILSQLLSWFTFLLFPRYLASLHQLLVPKSSFVSEAFLLGWRWLKRHVFFCSLCSWVCFPELSNSQQILSCTSQGTLPWFWQLQGILVQSLSRFLGSSSYKGRAKLPLFFLPSVRPKTYPLMSLGFLLPILNGPWLTDLAFLIFEGPLALSFNTYKILDLNNYQKKNQLKDISVMLIINVSMLKLAIRFALF